MFLKQRRRLEELEATEAKLLERIAYLKKDSPDSLKKRIETLLSEKTNLLKINTYLKKQVAKLSSDLYVMTKSVQMLNLGTSNLNGITKDLTTLLQPHCVLREI